MKDLLIGAWRSIPAWAKGAVAIVAAVGAVAYLLMGGAADVAGLLK